MNINDIVAVIDQQITQLQQARALLADNESGAPTGKRRGRPTGSVNQVLHKAAAPVAAKSGKRTMSPEGRARVAAAQKARWAAQKAVGKPANAAAKKSTAKPKAAKKQSAPKKQAAVTEA
jgi:hypothetical protein